MISTNTQGKGAEITNNSGANKFISQISGATTADAAQPLERRLIAAFSYPAFFILAPAVATRGRERLCE